IQEKSTRLLKNIKIQMKFLPYSLNSTNFKNKINNKMLPKEKKRIRRGKLNRVEKIKSNHEILSRLVSWIIAILSLNTIRELRNAFVWASCIAVPCTHLKQTFYVP